MANDSPYGRGPSGAMRSDSFEPPNWLGRPGSTATPYHLERVPQPPTTGLWADALRWIVAVMDADDPDLGFIASLLNHCLNHGGLTERQAKYAEKIKTRIEAHFDAGILAAQAGQID